MKKTTIRTFGAVLILFAQALSVPQQVFGESRTAVITNTLVRTDGDGNIMDAHDGCLDYFQGAFYLYGTRYGKTDGFTNTNRYVCYRSTNLTQWQFMGEALKDPLEGVYYRPYVKFNPQTKKYVLWYNWYAVLWEGQLGVALESQGF